MSILMDGNEKAFLIREDLKFECSRIQSLYNMTPKLAIILVGNNPASEVYVKSKEKACREIGIESIIVRLPKDTDQAYIETTVSELCDDLTINGVMVQLPLPDHIDQESVLKLIPFQKDVDGLTTLSAGRAFHGEDCLLPCTPKGIVSLLNEYRIPLKGKNAVIIGRSNLVGKPLAILLLKEDCTVTICHSKTKNLSEYTKKADIIVVAIGQDRFLKADYVKPGAIVIDVGINRTPDGLYGDVDFESVKDVAGYITPVPGGIGPMTVTMLLQNTIEAFYIQNHNKVKLN